jgi:serine phosphatase RsbU (regulator of sigma subunit)
MPKLTGLSTPGADPQFSFDAPITVGRGPLIDLSLEHKSVSRRHALLNWVDDVCFVVDLDSANGTFVNHSRITKPTRIRDGDQIEFGLVSARYEDPVASSPASRALKTPSSVKLLGSNARYDVSHTMAIRVEPTPRRVAPPREAQFLRDLGQLLSTSLDHKALMAFVLDQLFLLFGDVDRAFIGVWNRSAGALGDRLARGRSGNAVTVSIAPQVLREAVEKREVVFVEQSLDEDSSRRASTVGTTVCLPVVFQDEVHGVIQLDTTSAAGQFQNDQMPLLIMVSTQLGMCLAHIALHTKLVERELLEQDMMLARRIQHHFLPSGTPKVKGYDFGVDYSPAMAVGGDLYDFFALTDGRTGVLVGDVAGKGISAALYGAKIGSDIRYHSAAHSDPCEILASVNRAVSAYGEDGMFATALLVVLDAFRNEVTVANAGHLPPLARDAQGRVTELAGPVNPPLGINPKATFSGSCHRIAASQSIALFTDGVTEALDPSGRLYGDDRLREQLARANGPPQTTIDGILTSVRTFIDRAPQSDDVTLVCVRRSDSRAR